MKKRLKISSLLVFLLIFSGNCFSQKVRYMYKKDTVGLQEEIDTYLKRGERPPRPFYDALGYGLPMEISLILSPVKNNLFRADPESDTLFLDAFHDKKILLIDSAIYYILVDPPKKLAFSENWRIERDSIRFDSLYTYIDVRSGYNLKRQKLYFINDVGNQTDRYYGPSQVPITNIDFNGKLKNGKYLFTVYGMGEGINFGFIPKKGIVSIEIRGCTYKLTEVVRE